MKTILVLSLILSSAVSLGARVLYVDQSGGGDAMTIQEGIDMAFSGDTVMVESGTYFEDFITFSGKDIYLVSRAGPYSVEVKGRSGTQVFELSNGEGPDCVLKGFTVSSSTFGIWTTGSPVIRDNIITGTENVGILVTQGGSPLIKDNLILNNQEEGILVQSGSTPTIEGNLIYGNGSWGIYAPNDNATIIRNNVVIWNDEGIEAGRSPDVSGNLVAYSNNRGVGYGMDVKNNIILYNGFGISGTGNTYRVKSNNIIFACSEGIAYQNGAGDSLFNNVIIGCGKGISVVSESGPPIARNNILMNNEWGVYCYPAQDIDLSYNAVWGNTSGDYYGCTPGEGSVSFDPEFVDPANNHYALSSTSPLIDLGDPTILDPDSTRSDIGAYGGPNALPFALTLLPRDTILTRGEDNLLYDLILSNTTGLTQEVQAWAKVILSSREPYPGNPIVGPVSLNLDPYETLALPNPISHPVPQNAPTGIYEYKVLLGDPLGEIMTDSRFYFLIQP